MNIGELGKWIAKMAPRGVGDYKPMCVLLQAVLRDMISGKLRHNNATVVQLRDTVRAMQDLLRRIHDQYSETLTTMSAKLAEEHQMKVLQGLVTAASKLTAKIRIKRELNDSNLTARELDEELAMLRKSMLAMRARLEETLSEARDKEQAFASELAREKKKSSEAAVAAAERIVYLEGIIAKMHESGRGHQSMRVGGGSGDEHEWEISDWHREQAKELSAMEDADEALKRLAAMTVFDAARTLAAMKPYDAGALLDLVDAARAASLLDAMPWNVAADILGNMMGTAATAAISLMDPMNAAGALTEMEPAVAARLMSCLDPANAAIVLSLIHI